MQRTELEQLMTAEGLNLLDSLPPYTTGANIVRSVTALRKRGYSADLVGAVMTQARLRAKAVAKFGDFADRMLFTEAGLEQATRLNVAALHAGRFRAAGLDRVADLGCGIGADALAFAGLGLDVTAVDHDEVTAALASYNLAPFDTARVELGEAEAFELSRVDAVYFDPARRTAGHSNTSRLTDPDDYSPSLRHVFAVAERMPVGVKLGPGLDRELLPDDAEAQWVSVDGHVVETGLWFGLLARPGIRRSALVIAKGRTDELTAAADSADVDAGELGEFLYEPDGSVIRARLIGDLARHLGARMVSDQIAYLTSDDLIATPFATAFRVREVLPYNVATLKRELKARGIGRLEIKKRGVDLDPAALRPKLSLQGTEEATLFVTRIAGRHAAILADRLG
ncbi:class I SAM-dependent methyltransferase [Subtercola boreus]|uniref:SAM-dependent methyltransferase n=1 Tax=Subtercola boreus TaxID=120213 RepID=A0A3E0WA90_9MICO|nr:SAM-dependent methyltransferase [Subtercola boreus]RFA19399.1 SAM-dependent methyltransferase [Subtercola boreus]RFA19660.1 SAM-dependent methyltransferase [Subtercola boreus]RFA26025.1 SAM-dependent methyltransferase [Subtercola boreus]